jgi:CheY-like chemotaxis protein
MAPPLSSTLPPSARETPDGGRLRGVHVLVVDDNDDTRELIAMALEMEGAKVTQADSVPSAISAAASDNFDILLSDLGMPGEDGYELVRRLRAGEPTSWARQMPAVAVTAFARQEDRLKALAAGFQEHLPKPFDVLSLVDLVARLTARGGNAIG